VIKELLCSDLPIGPSFLEWSELLGFVKSDRHEDPASILKAVILSRFGRIPEARLEAPERSLLGVLLSELCAAKENSLILPALEGCGIVPVRGGFVAPLRRPSDVIKAGKGSLASQPREVLDFFARYGCRILEDELPESVAGLLCEYGYVSEVTPVGLLRALERASGPRSTPSEAECLAALEYFASNRKTLKEAKDFASIKALAIFPTFDGKRHHFSSCVESPLYLAPCCIGDLAGHPKLLAVNPGSDEAQLFAAIGINALSWSQFMELYGLQALPGDKL